MRGTLDAVELWGPVTSRLTKILFVVNMEMAFLTPPVGFNLFYIKGVASHDGRHLPVVTPFVMLQATALAIIMIFPDVVLWLPKLLLR